MQEKNNNLERLEKLFNIDINDFDLGETSIHLFRKNEFNDEQFGYRINGITNQPIEEWIGDEYYVIGIQELIADPIIAKVDEKEVPIYYMDHDYWANISKISDSLEDFLEILELSRKVDFENKDECRNFLENIEQKIPTTSHWFWEMIIGYDECENNSKKSNSEVNNNNGIFDILYNEKEMQALIKDIKFQKQVKKANKYIKIKYYLIIVLFIIFGIILVCAANDLDRVGSLMLLLFLIGIIYCLIGSFKEKKVYRKIKKLDIKNYHLLEEMIKHNYYSNIKDQFITYLDNRINNANNKITNEVVNNPETFSEWLDDVLQKELPKAIKAIHFNLYEDGNNKWSIELIGSSYFDEEDQDWPCNEVYTTRENPFVVIKEDSWENIERMFSDKINKYLNDGKYSDKIKKYEAVGIGFVEGNINILYKK